jgi:hypothetical protein
MNYVLFTNKVIKVEEKETDALFDHLWNEHWDSMVIYGAATDFENDFGPITHTWNDGKLKEVRS